MHVVSIRQVACHAGYPYHAAAIYRARQARAGHWVWELIESGPERRGDLIAQRDADALAAKYGSCRFNRRARHNSRIR